MSREIDWDFSPYITIYYGEGSDSIQSEVVHSSPHIQNLRMKESSFELLSGTQYSSELSDGERETVVSLDNSSSYLTITSKFDSKNPQQQSIMVLQDEGDEIKCAFGIKDGEGEDTRISIHIEIHMNSNGLFLVSNNRTTYGDFCFADTNETETESRVSIKSEKAEAFNLENRVIVMKPEGKKIAILCQSSHDDSAFYYTINLPFFTPATLYQAFRSMKLNPIKIREVLEQVGLQVECTRIPSKGKVKTCNLI